MQPIVRFAPSPTGFLHIGGARTALFNYLFAKNTGGKFLLRIEDTDKERSTPQAIQAIIEGLDWLGLEFDDDLVMQSQNINRHKEVAYEMLARNQAYWCYTPISELEELRKNSEKEGKVFRFQSPWRDKKEISISQETSELKPVLRLKAKKEGKTVINDLVQGEVSVSNEEIDDLVLLRGDGTPTYMLAVVVDDHDMEISHIIRGDDHLTNAFRQKAIYEAMSWKTPEFAHIPLIHGDNGAKLSKRHGATSVTEYKNLGYLPQTMRNYLLRLGWSCGDLEIISDQKAIELFNLEKIGRSPSRFDFSRLKHLNNHYIRQKLALELFDLCKNFLPKKPNEQEKIRFLRVIEFAKEKVELLIELAQICTIFYDEINYEIKPSDKELIFQKQQILVKIIDSLLDISEWSAVSIKSNFEQFCTQNQLKIRDFGLALRSAITFSSASAGGLFEVIEILGKEEVLRRIRIQI